MDDFEKELKEGFLEEAEQALNDTEQCFLSMEKNPADMDNLNKIFRLAHNLKGSSKAVGFHQMGEFTHEFESFILKIKNGSLTVNSSVINLLFRGNDFVKEMVKGLRENLDAQFDIDPLIQELNQDVPVQDTHAPDFAHPSSDNQQFPNPIPIEEAISLRNSAPSTVNAAAESIRVNADKIESLMNFISEMVIMLSVVKDHSNKMDWGGLCKSLSQLEKISKEIQDVSMSMRMLPVRPIFQKMQRIVRDTAQALGKEIEFKTLGEETEVDKSVLERITDPLVHLIRNSVDHGVEKRETRLNQGKDPIGHVSLEAYHRSGKLFIEVKDDGGGLDPQRLRNKAIEKKLIAENQNLTSEQCYQLIFAPGFSTKEVVTDISGRGVGMDVVKTNLTELGGTIDVQSQLGHGTKFQICLPLTLAIIDGLIVSSAGEKYIFPFAQIFETVAARDTDINFNVSLGQTLNLRGEIMPLVYLEDIFKKTPSKNSNKIAIIIRSGSSGFALIVDDVLGKSQIVVKPLTPELHNIRGAIGSTILGDGKPALILEPTDLIKIKTVSRTHNERDTGGKVA